MLLEEDSSLSIESNRKKYAHYSDDYKNVAFQIWYSNSRPSAVSLKKMLPPDEFNRTPELNIINTWMKVWQEEGDILDLEVKKQIDLDLVSQRASMLKKQAEMGKQLQEMGMEFLVNTGFDKAGDALRALVEGVRIERESRGLGEALDRIFKMDDEALRKELVHLLQRDAGVEVIVDGDISEVDDADSESSTTE